VEPAEPADAQTPATPAPAADPTPGPAGAAAVTPKRSERSPRDMALSMVVLLIPIVLLLGFYRLLFDGDEPIGVDPAPALAEARAAGAFPVLEPTGLPADWTTSTATFRRTAEGATLRIGYVNPDGDPLQLVQSSVPAATLLPAELGKTGPGGTVQVGSRTWQRYESRPGEEAIVLSDKGRTVIVVGATELGQLQTLAAALS
jgi:hypothetical protein